jgi:hypothetical protein
MRSAVRCIIAIGIAALALWGCASSPDAAKVIPATFATVAPARKHIHQIAAILGQVPPTPLGRQIGELYEKTLVHTIRAEGPLIRVRTFQDPELPDFFSSLARPNETSADASDVAEAARLAGYNGWAVARIMSLRTVEERTGVLWFRKTRPRLFFDLTLELYDAFTSAKLIDEVVESSIRITPEDYQTFQTGGTEVIESLNKAVAGFAEDMGAKVVGTIQDQPWCATVVKVQGDHVYLSVGLQSGLQAGERLAVFEGRRTMEGQNGAKFKLPGFQIGEIKIVTITAQIAEARDPNAHGDSKIKAGDVAVAIQG